MVTTSLVICIVAGFIGLWVLFYFIPVGLWFTALISGVHISLLQLILMRWRKVPPQTIVRAMIEAHKAGLQGIKRNDLEAHYLAGGHVEAVVHALQLSQVRAFGQVQAGQMVVGSVEELDVGVGARLQAGELVVLAVQQRQGLAGGHVQFCQLIG